MYGFDLIVQFVVCPWAVKEKEQKLQMKTRINEEWSVYYFKTFEAINFPLAQWELT